MNYRMKMTYENMKGKSLWKILFINDSLSRYIEDYCIVNRIETDHMKDMIMKYGNRGMGKIRVRMLERTVRGEINL